MTNETTTTPSWTPSAIVAAGLTSARDAELWLRARGIDPSTIDDEALPAAITEAKCWQEAESRKYGNAGVLVLPLQTSPDRFAIFAIDRQGIEIVEIEDLADTIRSRSKVFEQRLRTQTLHVERLRDLGLDEPSPSAMARDIRRGATTARRPSGDITVATEAIDF